MTVLDVVINEKHYAIDTDEVLEYSPYSMPEHGDLDPACIEGRIMHGDDSYAVVDMRRYLKAEPSKDGFFVYLRQKEPCAALHVDAVSGVYMDAPADLELLSAASIVRDVLSGGATAATDGSSAAKKTSAAHGTAPAADGSAAMRGSSAANGSSAAKGVPAPPDNHELEAVLTEYTKSRSSDSMKRISQLLQSAHVFVPGMLDDRKQPRLSLIKDKDGRMFLPAFTSQENVPMQPKPPAVFCVPFEELSRNALSQGTKLAGVMINPGTHSVILRPALTKAAEGKHDTQIF